MRRVFQGLAVVWALGLVGWAIASAQGWLKEGKPVVDAEPAMFRGTKSDAGEGARAKVLVVEESTGKVDVREENPEVLFSGTKSDAVNAIGGLIGTKGGDALLPGTKSLGGLSPGTGTEMAPGGIGARGKLDAKSREQGSE